MLRFLRVLFTSVLLPIGEVLALLKEFEQSKLNNPVTDIVDAYYVAKAGYDRV